MNCVICYDIVEKKYVKCSDVSCNVVVCTACFDELMDFCLKESQMVTCPNRGCLTHYMAGSIPALSLELYEDVCTNYLINFTKPQVDEINKYDAIVQKMRNEKTKFVKETFSPAIFEILNIAYKKEMKKVKKNNSQLLDKMLTGRRCVGFMCRGMMEINEVDNVYDCSLCKSRFCKECERQKKELREHKCNQEDLDSVKAISDLVKCPTCRFPVIKSVGCNSITCSICRTNFDYITGGKSQAGNHTHDAPIAMRNHNTLYEIYADDYKEKRGILDLLVEIDSLLPKLMDIKILVKYISIASGEFDDENGGLDRKTKKILTRKYVRYLRGCMQMKIYRKELMKIKSAHETKTLTEDVLSNVLVNLI